MKTVVLGPSVFITMKMNFCLYYFADNAQYRQVLCVGFFIPLTSLFSLFEGTERLLVRKQTSFISQKLGVMQH